MSDPCHAGWATVAASATKHIPPMLHGPAFLLDLTHHGAYAVVRAEGELDIAAVPRLQTCVRRAARRSSLVVVDLRGVAFMDTFALTALIALQEESAQETWSMHCVPGPGIQRLLDLADARDALRWIAAEQLAG
jgi:anti-anti-sigma factor